jgi:hypothetical protein
MTEEEFKDQATLVEGLCKVLLESGFKQLDDGRLVNVNLMERGLQAGQND